MISCYTLCRSSYSFIRIQSGVRSYPSGRFQITVLLWGMVAVTALSKAPLIGNFDGKSPWGRRVRKHSLIRTTCLGKCWIWFLPCLSRSFINSISFNIFLSKLWLCLELCTKNGVISLLWNAGSWVNRIL